MSNREVIAKLFEDRERMRLALEEIAEGKGRFSNDPFKHACNTIEDMKQLAREALDHGLPTAEDVRGILRDDVGTGKQP